MSCIPSISEITDDVTGTFLADRKTQCQLAGRDVSVLVNNGLSKAVLELCSSSFRSHHSFCLVPVSVSGGPNTLIKIVKVVVVVPQSLILGNEEVCMHIIDCTLKHCCCGALGQES
jgi:hypothetical protein